MMNFNFIWLVSYLSFCWLLLPNVTKPSSANTINTTNNLASLEIDNSNLSPTERASLERGEIVLKGEKGEYLGLVVAEGNMDAAWLVITDYANFSEFLPNISNVKVLSESNNKIIFEQTNLVDLWLFQQEFKVKIDATKYPSDRVEFQIVEGDLQKLIGSWQIQPTKSNKILVAHRVEVEPAGDIEKPFFYGVYESSH